MRIGGLPVVGGEICPTDSVCWVKIVVIIIIIIIIIIIKLYFRHIYGP